MTKQTHTPLPWKIKYDEPQDKILRVVVANGDSQVEPIGEVLIHGGSNIDKAGLRSNNIFFIVRAVNSHYELVEILKETLGAIVFLDGENKMPDYENFIARIKSALAKAEGEVSNKLYPKRVMKLWIKK